MKNEFNICVDTTKDPPQLYIPDNVLAEMREEIITEGLQKELDRNRELLVSYKEIGFAGMFGHAVIEGKIKYTEKAIAEGDTVKMLACYDELKMSK